MEDAAYLLMLCQEHWSCLKGARLQTAEFNTAQEQTQTNFYFFVF